MPLFGTRRTHATRAAPVTRTRKPGFFSRFGRTRRTAPVGATTTRSTRRTRRTKHAHAAPVGATTRRRPTIGDRIHGAAKSLAGTLTMNRRKKAAGVAMQTGGTTRTTRTRRHGRW